jgi:peptide/nickel transport system substrate-binding protein
MAAELRDEWKSTEEGILLSRQDNWLYGSFQFGRQWARPVELSQDVRMRRGLYQAIDRRAIAEVMLPGFPDTNGDTFMPRNDPRAPLVGEPFARYRYDPVAAAQQLAAAGWRRGADGRLVNQEGRQLQIEVLGANDTWTKEVALVADYWRQLGIDAAEVIPSRALARDNERMAAYTGVMIRARSSAENVFQAFDSRFWAASDNRFASPNRGQYANADLDQLIDRLHRTIDERQQGLILKEMGEIIAIDLPAMPIYFRTNFAAVRRSVHALTEDYKNTPDTREMARMAHLWDRS